MLTTHTPTHTPSCSSPFRGSCMASSKQLCRILLRTLIQSSISVSLSAASRYVLLSCIFSSKAKRRTLLFYTYTHTQIETSINIKHTDITITALDFWLVKRLLSSFLEQQLLLVCYCFYSYSLFAKLWFVVDYLPITAQQEVFYSFVLPHLRRVHHFLYIHSER